LEGTFSVNTLIVVAAFFLFQLIYYAITQRKYNRDIIKTRVAE